MDFFEVIEKRYSVRAYKPDPVEDEKLDKILEAARIAPTAHNNQPFQIIVIPTENCRAALKRIYPREWFSQAPLVICVCGIAERGWVRGYDKRSYLEVDIAIVMDHIILAATALGLGTCWVGAFNAPPAVEFLQTPPGIEPILFTPLGYPADQPGERERKPISELVRYEHY